MTKHKPKFQTRPKSTTPPTQLEQASHQAGYALVQLTDWLNSQLPQLQRYQATLLVADLLMALPEAFKETTMMHQLKLRAEQRFGIKTDASPIDNQQLTTDN